MKSALAGCAALLMMESACKEAVPDCSGLLRVVPVGGEPVRARYAHPFERHEPVLPENRAVKPDAANAEGDTPGSELNPHLRAVLKRLKERARERRR